MKIFAALASVASVALAISMNAAAFALIGIVPLAFEVFRLAKAE